MEENMAIYEYKCGWCGKEVTVNHPMTEDPEVACPTCGTSMNRKITGGQGVIFKGPGFPGNDMKKKDAYAKEQEKNEKESRTKRPWELI